MTILKTAQLVTGLCLFASLMGCKGGGSGCGKDYADPAKQFCIKLPAGYKVDPNIEKNSLYTELVRFTGEQMGDGMSVAVGTSNSNYATYQDEIDGEERLLKLGGRKIESTGATQGDQGKWWLYNFQDYRIIESIVKAPNGKALMCKPSNTTPSASAYEVCKTLRPFPTKS